MSDNQDAIYYSELEAGACFRAEPTADPAARAVAGVYRRRALDAAAIFSTSLHEWLGRHVADLKNSHWERGQFVSS
jgi:hypothetical protein